MIACLRSAQFIYPDRSASVLIELRRHHDIRSNVGSKEFIVTRRTTFRPMAIHNKSFGTLAEARRFWMAEVSRLTDSGLVRRDVPIVGFHEED